MIKSNNWCCKSTAAYFFQKEKNPTMIIMIVFICFPANLQKMQLILVDLLIISAN